jgi:hypothetical protein
VSSGHNEWLLGVTGAAATAAGPILQLGLDEGSCKAWSVMNGTPRIRTACQALEALLP